MINVNKGLHHHCYQTSNQLLIVQSLLLSPVAVDIIKTCERDEGAAHASSEKSCWSYERVHDHVVASPVAVGAGEPLGADPEHGVLAAADLARAPGAHALGGARGVGHRAEGARGGGGGGEAGVPGHIQARDQAQPHWGQGFIGLDHFRKVFTFLLYENLWKRILANKNPFLEWWWQWYCISWWQWLNVKTLLTPGSLSGDWCLVLGSGHNLKVVVLLYPETVHHHPNNKVTDNNDTDTPKVNQHFLHTRKMWSNKNFLEKGISPRI